MKFPKLYVSALTGCVLVGASGAAMAVNECSEGAITGQVNDDIVVEDRSCTINDANVAGSITAANAEDLTIAGSNVSGDITVTESRFATIAVNSARRVEVTNNEAALVSANVARRIRVNNNVVARVNQNGVVNAIVCRGNIRLEAKGNNVENIQGRDECPLRGGL